MSVKRKYSAGAERGFALLIVLWTLVPLSLMFLVLTATARSEMRAATDLRTAAALEAEADGAISTALFGLLAQGNKHTLPSGPQEAGRGVVFEVSNLSGRLNPNTVSPELLRAFIDRLGFDDDQAIRVAAAVVDWRTPGQQASWFGAKAPEYRSAGLSYGPPGAPFESLDELGQVLGMTPPLLQALLPAMSLYGYGDPNPATAPAALRNALQDVGKVRATPDLATQVVQITATAQGPGRAVASRRAVVWLGPSATGRPWRVLDWNSPFDH